MTDTHITTGKKKKKKKTWEAKAGRELGAQSQHLDMQF